MIRPIVVLDRSCVRTVSRSVAALGLVLGAVACGVSPDGEPSAASASAIATTSRDALPDGYVHVPNGVIAHVDCIHEIPNGSHVDVDGNVTVAGVPVAHYDACAHPLIHTARPNGFAGSDPGPTGAPALSNWVEASWTNAAANEQFIDLSDTFNVPSPPVTEKDTTISKTGQIVYLFPSIQSTDLYIIQPVLQWGVWGGGTAGTGNSGGSASSIGSSTSWTLAAWGVTANTVYHSPGLTVATGHSIQGIIQGQTQTTSGSSWNVTGNDTNTGVGRWIGVDFPGKGLWNNAQAGVLEAYYVNSCKDFPASSTVFSYPYLSLSTFGSPWTSKTTAENPNEAIWSELYWNNGLTSGYSGPTSCGFTITPGTTASGATLKY